MRRTPLVPPALAMMAGIACQHWLTGVPAWGWWTLMLTAALAGGIALAVRRRPPLTAIVLLASLCMAGIGGTLGHLGDPRHDTRHWTRAEAMLGEEPKAYMSVRVAETPMPRGRSLRAKARVESVDGTPADGDIRLYLKNDSTAATVHYGDRLLLHGYPDRENGSVYLTSNHYIVTQRDSTSLRARSEALRMRLLGRMQEGPLARREGAIAEAMTLGWRADLEPQTQTAFRDAGLAHLLAVSGLHVGLLAALVGWLMVWAGHERRGRTLRGAVQLATVWLFALLTGLAPSTVRAALMFSLFIVSNILGRRTPKMNLLALAAIVMLTAQPMLLFDVGWQLSFSAVAGILLAQPVIGQHRNFVWQATVVSIAATLATMPVTLTVFHRLQPWFLVANVAIVPLAGVILALSLAYMAVPCAATAWPLGWTLRGAEGLTQWVSGLPGASIEVAAPPVWLTVALALAVLTLLLAANRLVPNYK